jgi:hypothetical protein
VNTLMIGYDLDHRTPKAYAALTQAIKELGPTWHELDSTWFVSTALTPVEVRDILNHYLRPEDMLLVLALPPLWWAAWGLDHEDAAWLHERL